MRLAHIAIATPNRCGLYETARELVAAERSLGVDARIVDPRPIPSLYPESGEDRGVPLADMGWAVSADVVVSHSGHDETPVAESDQPIIHVAHGRPLSTFLGERAGNAPAYSYQVVRSQSDRYRACVTFWPEYEPYLRELWIGKPVHVLHPTADLEHWCPGETTYDFAGKAGGYNVVMADPWCRADVSPFHTIHAFALFRRIHPEAKLHIYAAETNQRGYAALFRVLGDSLGVVQGWASDLRRVYRAADMLITPHRIYTRSIREAMACGIQVVSGRDAHVEDIEQFAVLMANRRERPLPTRTLAQVLFDPTKAANAMIRLAESVAMEAVT